MAKSKDIAANINTTATLDGDPFFGGSFSGQLETAGDHDWIKVELQGLQAYNLYASLLYTGSATQGDSFIRIFDSAGVQVPNAFNDDGGVFLNSFLSFTPATSGTFFIDIGDAPNSHSGEYSIFMLASGPANHELTPFNDNFTGIVANEIILGGMGADTITIGAGVDALGDQGNDIITGNSSNNHISGGLGDDTIHGGAGADGLFGEAGHDDIFGDAGADSIWGGSGDDIIDGGADNDDIIGGLGKDFMTGGSDHENFIFFNLADSKRGLGRDVITDFEEGGTDFIGLTEIDAKRGGADNAFHFIGSKQFHDKAGELRFKINAASNLTIVEGDVNGDGKADFQIELSGQHVLLASDFQL